MSIEELPEHQIFHVLRQGETEPIGPYSQNQLVELLNEEAIRPNDFVYYPELSGWKSLSQVFDLHQRIANFDDEGQDPHVVSESFALVSERCEPGENIYYVAVQHVPALSLTAAVKFTSPKSFVVTDLRIFVITPKFMSTPHTQEYAIEEIEKVIKRVGSKDRDGKFILVLKSGEWVEIDKIPADQLERAETIVEELISGTPA